jgi:hypothetical protein
VAVFLDLHWRLHLCHPDSDEFFYPTHVLAAQDDSWMWIFENLGLDGDELIHLLQVLVVFAELLRSSRRVVFCLVVVVLEDVNELAF